MLKNKVVLVTGAARGIGQQAALDFAKQGAQLVLADLTPCEETRAMLDKLGADYTNDIVDITDFSQCQKIVDLATQKFGRVDGLAHLAAVYANLTMGPFEDIPSGEFELCMKVNVEGTWNICRAVSPIMKNAGVGSIVNVVSNTAIAGWPGLAHYAASKGACITITRVMARELGQFNIRVNSVAPTGVTTDSTKQLIGDDYDAVMSEAASLQIIRRNADAEDITGAIAYLLSDSSRIVTGQCLAVDCGMTLN